MAMLFRLLHLLPFSVLLLLFAVSCNSERSWNITSGQEEMLEELDFLEARAVELEREYAWVEMDLALIDLRELLIAQWTREAHYDDVMRECVQDEMRFMKGLLKAADDRLLDICERMREWGVHQTIPEVMERWNTMRYRLEARAQAIRSLHEELQMHKAGVDVGDDPLEGSEFQLLRERALKEVSPFLEHKRRTTSLATKLV